MANPEKKWNKFQRLNVKPGRFSEHAKRAESATVRHAHEFIVDRIHNAREVRRNIALWLLGMGVLIGIATMQFFLFQASYTTLSGVDGGTYAEGVRGDINTLNPLFASTHGEQAAARLMFSSLFTYDESGALRGDLAEKYTVLDEGTRYRVKLKPVAFWHDGTRVSADDILYTINLIKNPAARAPSSASWQNIDVKKIDERTIDFILPAVYAPFPNAMTFYILPEHILGETDPSIVRDAKFSTYPVGSGPFSFRLRQDVGTDNAYTVIHMTQNKRYYNGAPKIERFQLHGYDSDENLSKALRSHAVNAVAGLSSNAYEQVRQTGEYEVRTQPVNSGVYGIFNTKSAVLSEEKVRQALQLGTNTKEASDALPVEVKPLDAPILGSQTDLEGVEKPSLDKKKAAKLLEEAGWKKKDGKLEKDGQPLTLKVVSIKTADYVPVVANLAKQWRELGISVNTQTVDTDDPTQNLASSVLQPRDFDVLIHELYLGSDPDVYAFWHSSQATERGLNFSGYRNDISDDTLASARLRVESDLRSAKYKAFVKQWYKDAPAIGLYQSQLSYAHTDTVSPFSTKANLVASPDRFNDVIHWTAQQGPVYKTP